MSDEMTAKPHSLYAPVYPGKGTTNADRSVIKKVMQRNKHYGLREMTEEGLLPMSKDTPTFAGIVNNFSKEPEYVPFLSDPTRRER